MKEKRKKCEICGFDRVVDRCHLIPQSIADGVVGLRKYKGYRIKKNIICLCKNHHFLFDNYKLTEEEWMIVMPRFNDVWEDVEMLQNSNLIPKTIVTKSEHKRKVKKVNKWLGIITDLFEKYGKTN